MIPRAHLLFSLAITTAACSPRTRALSPKSSSAPTSAPDWSYEVSASAAAQELVITATLPPGSEPELGIDDGAEPFVRDVALQQGDRWEPVAPKDAIWVVPSCRTAGCRVRYRFLLADASRKLDDPDLAQARADVFVAPPSTWLLRPLHDAGDRAFRFHVTTPEGVVFATGVSPFSDQLNTYRATVADLPMTPYSAFGPLRTKRIDQGGRTIDIELAPGRLGVDEETLFSWIATSADTVARYYGRFPVDRVLLIVLPSDGSGMGYGKTLGNGGASIVLPLGRTTTERGLREDWVLVHEMIHLAFPSLPRQHIWLEEGLATYIEPIARARAGRLSRESAWSGMVRGLAHGLPEAGDQGLDNTHTWGRTYWGGTLFCLLADLEIRERTGGRFSLDDALRAIVARGGNISVRWDITRALEEGDRATGVPVLTELYRRMGTQPHPVDLPALFGKLGVKVAGESVVFDDGAPLAGVRRSITEPH